MIDKKDVIEFFDACAPSWDAEMIRSDDIINIILDNAHISAGAKVLDVACGTGVLAPDYLKRDVESVTGVDISAEMIKLARQKNFGEKVSFICGDVETVDLSGGYDAVMVYNAFPHFPQPQRLISRLSSLLRIGGALTVAHGMSREKIDHHHSGSAHRVSNGLMEADRLAELFSVYLDVETVISNGQMYQVTGIRTR